MFLGLVCAAGVVFAGSLALLLWMSRAAPPSAEVLARREQRMWTMINRERFRVDRKELRRASSEELFTELDRWTSS